MSRTITQIKNILGRKFRGANIDEVQGISDYTVFQEAAETLLSKIDPFESRRTSEVNLFNEVYDYDIPADLKGRKVMDIRPQDDNSRSGDFRQSFTEAFDREKSLQNNFFSVEMDEFDKFIRIDKAVSNSLAFTDVTTTNYTAGTGVSNIAADTILKLNGETSLRFDVSSGTNLLTWAGTAVDLSTHENKSTLFMEVYWPDSSIITSIVARIGSDASNYFEITGAIQRGSIRTGVNQYKFAWDGATETGTVDATAMDYVRYDITTTGADTDIRISDLTSKLPEPSEILYYSNYLFRDSSGTWLELPSADTDLLNLEGDSQNIFIYECCAIIADDLQRAGEAQKFETHLNGDAQRLGLYDDYLRDKPSEAIRSTSNWYGIPRGGGRRYGSINRTN